SGISLLSVDGSNSDGVTIDNITMTGASCPVFLRLGNRGRDLATPKPGSLRNVVVSNLVANDAQWPCTIAGIPGHAIEGVSLQNLRINYQGGSTREQGLLDVPEHIGKYPNANMFGILPAYGFYCRHAHDLHLANIRLKCAAADWRCAVLCEDVSGLVIDALETQPAPSAAAVLRFREVRDAFVRGCRPAEATDVFLKVSGAQSKAISLV